ncbi:MAG TPA: putative lipid II flippase FtsW [Actinomycetota bacterium]|nr:putative lipid II flippase FtsW [Actinomycetota bacterium]
MATRSGTLGAASKPRTGTRASTATKRGEPATLVMVATGALVLLGLVMILSASSVSSFATYGSSFLYFNKQLLWAAIGLAGFVFFSRYDYRRLKGKGYVLLPIVGVLLIAVLIPGVGIVAGGSARWIGAGPLAFQPSELAKLALILFLADVFSRKEEATLQDLAHTLLPFAPVLGGLAFLVMMQPDMGTTLLVGSIGIGMLFAAGAPLRYILPMGALGLAGAVGAALSADYRRERVLAFMDPWADPLNTGYHTIQSLIALGSGGWLGVGLGASRQKWSYIPNAHTDFIFAILGEEMGLLGTITVLGLFGFIAYLGVRIARTAPDRFGMLVAAGITIWIGVQALVNIGAVTATMPITGVPLPLVSFGGSSLVVSLMAMGVLTNIARQARKPRRKKRPATG